MIYELEQTLKESIVTVVFTKLNGEERRMKCTQDLTKIPSDKMPIQEALPTAVNTNVCRVFDFEKNDWRSFRKDTLITWSL